MKSFGKNFGLLILCLVAAYFFAVPVGEYYLELVSDPGSFIDARLFVGFPLVFLFVTTSLYAAFGAKGKYWWMGVLLIPALAFEVYFDLEHIYVPIVLGVVGWAIGFATKKLLGGEAS